MSGTGNAATTAAGLLSAAEGQLAASASTSWLALLSDLDTDAIGLADQEAEDAGTFITNLVQDVEGGMTLSAAYAKESAAFVATEKSQLYQDFVNALGQFAGVFDKAVTAIQSIL